MNCLASFIDISVKNRKYLCYLCFENNNLIAMFTKQFLNSPDVDEKLSALRFIWLIVYAKSIATSLKADYRLVHILRELSESNSGYSLRTFSGAVLYNLFTKFEDRNIRAVKKMQEQQKASQKYPTTNTTN